MKLGGHGRHSSDVKSSIMGLSALGLESQRESQGQSDQILMKELEAAAQLDGNNNSNIEDVEALLNSKVSTETDKVAPTKGED